MKSLNEALSDAFLDRGVQNFIFEPIKTTLIALKDARKTKVPPRPVHHTIVQLPKERFDSRPEWVRLIDADFTAKNHEAVLKWGKCMDRTRRIEKRTSPEHASRMLTRISAAALQLREFKAAATFAGRAIAILPCDAPYRVHPLCNLANVRMHDDLPAAQALVSEAMQIDSASEVAIYNFACVYSRSERGGEVREALSRLVRLHPRCESVQKAESDPDLGWARTQPWFRETMDSASRVGKRTTSVRLGTLALAIILSLLSLTVVAVRAGALPKILTQALPLIVAGSSSGASCIALAAAYLGSSSGR